VREWHYVEHHKAHAALGFYDSPFQSAAVFSIDGGGNDGCFRVFHADSANGIEAATGDYVESLRWINMGVAYAWLASIIQELRPDTKLGPPSMDEVLSLPGKFMALAARGNVRPHWSQGLMTHFWNFNKYYWAIETGNLTKRKPFPETLLYDFSDVKTKVTTEGELYALTADEQFDLSSSAQAVFEKIIIEVMERIDRDVLAFKDVEGLVLTGGCAMNVKANDLVRLTFDKPTFVPSAPGDAGLPVGAAWLFHPPPHRPAMDLAYGGPRVFDINDLDTHATQRNAIRVSHPDIAAILAQKHIIGMIHGRTEVGPRALGHRSLLGYPDSEGMKAKFNTIKHRQWYRPVAPIVAVEYTAKFIEHSAAHPSVRDKTKADSFSPYMSFSPQMTVEASKMFPAVAHLDNSTRIQTVSASENSWLHELLMQVWEKCGAPVLANTSLNVRGQPIINSIRSALELFDKDAEPTVMIIETWAFREKKGPPKIRDIRIELGIIPPPPGYDGPLPTEPWTGEKS